MIWQIIFNTVDKSKTNKTAALAHQLGTTIKLLEKHADRTQTRRRPTIGEWSHWRKSRGEFTQGEDGDGWAVMDISRAYKGRALISLNMEVLLKKWDIWSRPCNSPEIVKDENQQPKLKDDDFHGHVVFQPADSSGLAWSTMVKLSKQIWFTLRGRMLFSLWTSEWKRLHWSVTAWIWHRGLSIMWKDGKTSREPLRPCVLQNSLTLYIGNGFFFLSTSGGSKPKLISKANPAVKFCTVVICVKSGFETMFADMFYVTAAWSLCQRCSCEEPISSCKSSVFWQCNISGSVTLVKAACGFKKCLNLTDDRKMYHFVKRGRGWRRETQGRSAELEFSSCLMRTQHREDKVRVGCRIAGERKRERYLPKHKYNLFLLHFILNIISFLKTI